VSIKQQESPAVANKPARRESMPKLLQFDVLTTLSLTARIYLHSFSRYCLQNTRNVVKFEQNLTLQQFKVIQGHRSIVSMESPYV